VAAAPAVQPPARAIVRGVNSIIEGRSVPGARSPEVVLGANCMGLLPVSGSDRMQFGTGAAPGADRPRPNRRYSLPSMMLFGVAKRR
jgi:hypothetical protein